MLPEEPDERIKAIENMSNFNSKTLQKTFYNKSLPVLKEFKTSKRKWEKLEHSDLRVESQVRDPTYLTVKESMMFLDNNRGLHDLMSD